MTQKAPSDQELQAMSLRCQAATTGPVGLINQGRGRVALCLTSEQDDQIVLLGKFYGPDRVANADLAAHASQDIQRLVREVKRLRGLLRKHGIPYMD